MRRLLVVLPCYNEENSLPELLDQLAILRHRIRRTWQLSVLVVNDGSVDTTPLVASAYSGEMDVRLIDHLRNRGLGAALKTSIDLFLAMEDNDAPEVMAVLDADGTHPPLLLDAMLAELDRSDGETQCEVVIASRYAPGGEEHGLPLIRRIYSRLASLVLGAVARVRGVRDYTCGYRVYRREALERAKAKFSGETVKETCFVCMAELLVKLARCGARFGEVPLKLHYELKGGPSKMNVPVTIWRYVVLVWNVLFSRQYR